MKYYTLLGSNISHPQGAFEDDFPPQVGCVFFLEGITPRWWWEMWRMEDDVSTHDAFIHKDRHTFRYNQKRDRILGGDGQICLYCLIP